MSLDTKIMQINYNIKMRKARQAKRILEMFFYTTNTCICTRSSVFIRREASLSFPSPRWPHKESISSIKIMEGALSRAIWKRFDTSFSLSPIHFETRSDEEMLLKKTTQFLLTNI